MNKKQEILKQAELKVREGGYNNFSFRELANDVGIKSASVHYYFPTKADLGAELAAQYTLGFLDLLGDPKVYAGDDSDNGDDNDNDNDNDSDNDSDNGNDKNGASVSDIPNPILRYINVFRTALTVDKKMCLCGLFGAEIAGLPDKVRFETEAFFEKNIEWLTLAYKNVGSRSDEVARKEAIKLLSLLEGVMLMSNAMGDAELFEICVGDIEQSFG